MEWELIYRDDPLSREALDYVERRLQAIVSYEMRARLEQATRRSEPPVFTVTRSLIAPREKGMVLSLSALVPLILILMTITGAVYPAIDLTAGERERGTLETLIAAPPDVLLRSDYRAGQYSGEQRWLAHPVARHARAGRTVATDGRRWTCMGPSLIDEIERLRAELAA